MDGATGVRGLAFGDRVAVALSLHCHECHYCRIGRGNTCERWNAIGVSVPGGAAEYSLAPAANCVKLPEHVRTEGAATSTATAVLDASGAADSTFDITWALSASAEETLRDGRPTHVHTGSVATALRPGADQVLSALRAPRGSATVSYDPGLQARPAARAAALGGAGM